MKHNRKLVAVLIVLILLAGCASAGTSSSAKATAWKSLMTGKQTYDLAFTTMAALDKQGKLPANVKTKAIAAGTVYMNAHNAAVQALLNDQTPEMAGVTAALNAFMAIVAPYIGGGK